MGVLDGVFGIEWYGGYVKIIFSASENDRLISSYSRRHESFINLMW